MQPRRRPELDGLRRRARRRSVSVHVSRGCAPRALPRVPADPASRLLGRRRRSVPAGVVRRPASGLAVPRQLRAYRPQTPAAQPRRAGSSSSRRAARRRDARGARGRRPSRSAPPSSTQCASPAADRRREYAVAREHRSRSFWARAPPPRPRSSCPSPAFCRPSARCSLQELEMTWRYSVGDAYEELSYAEALDVAQVMAGYGYRDVSRQILRYTLRRLPARFTNWRAGERMVAGAQYFRLTGDRRYVSEEITGACCDRRQLARDVARTACFRASVTRPTSPDDIYSLQGQTLVWQGLLAMAASGLRLGTRRSPSARVRLGAASNAGCAGPLPRRSVGCRTGRSSSRRHCSTAVRRSSG